LKISPGRGLLLDAPCSDDTVPELNQSPLFVAMVIAALGLLIGFSKGGFVALGALLTPMLSLVLPVSQAVGVLLPMLMVGDAFAIYFYRRQWDTALIKRMLPVAAIGALAGTFLLANLPADVMRVALAVFVLFLVAYKFASDSLSRLRYQPRRWHAPAAGSLAGLASGMFNNGGPPFSSFLLLQKYEPRVFIATTALFFGLLNLIKVPGYLYTGVLNLPLLFSFWWVFLFIPPGIWAARWLVTRIDPRSFEWVIVVLLLFSSGVLIWQSR
jgi:hypothetical protein